MFSYHCAYIHPFHPLEQPARHIHSVSNQAIPQLNVLPLQLFEIGRTYWVQIQFTILRRCHTAVRVPDFRAYKETHPDLDQCQDSINNLT